ncbi:hypothetical protein RSOLAG22IIIB_05756 [Rhizoctonia solani]|uniref:Protein kinase domain-containing protein n=1 Tax=Rhizoctonia solani TaxID=456999 RepID=A0A0K6G9N5_9AGAM|nr:hypothetical protein RSOLAG22IIIB_05756 [Rhizoctonia solani]
MTSTEAPSEIRGVSTPLSSPTNSVDSLISRKMAAQEVVSLLVAHGCQDLSEGLDLASFSEYPLFHGGFSDIYRGQLLSGTRIALKALRVSGDSINRDPKHVKQAAREISTWGRCRHPNVIPLLGLAIFRDRIGMVAPWMGNGSLPLYLRNVPGANRFNMCVQIGEGLSYLHQIRIIHCDLKGANVLVSDEGIPCLTDFGTSLVSDRTLGFTQTTSGPAFTVRWSAAEIIEETSPHTEASDVYALGMTIYETMTGKAPYHGKGETNVMLLVTVKKEFPERPESIPNDGGSGDDLWKLLVRCWSFDPTLRPSADEVTTTTQLVLSVVERTWNNWDPVIYVDASSTEALEKALHGFGKAKNIGEEYTDVEQYIPARGERGSISITTRLPDLANLADSPDSIYPLSGMSPTNGTTLLVKIASSRNQRLSEDNTKLAGELVRDFGCLTLAIVHAGAYIAHLPGMTITEYRSLFLSQRQRMLEEYSELPAAAKVEKSGDTVYTTCKMCYDQLKPESCELLWLVVYLHYDRISVPSAWGD